MSFIKGNEKLYGVFLMFLGSLLASCAVDDKQNSVPDINESTVFFHNRSSFRVNIFKNLNPEYFDSTTFVLSVDDGATKSIKLVPSIDKFRGDTFYPHYEIPLADKIETQTKDIFAEAERQNVYISLVIESGKIYNNPPLYISQPNAGELRLLHGYIFITNLTNRQINLIRGLTSMYRMDNDSPYIDPNKTGFYKIEFPYLFNTLSMDQLYVFTSDKRLLPNFTMKKGKKYIFTIRDDVIEGPEELEILPMGLL